MMVVVSERVQNTSLLATVCTVGVYRSWYIQVLETTGTPGKIFFTVCPMYLKYFLCPTVALRDILHEYLYE